MADSYSVERVGVDHILESHHQLFLVGVNLSSLLLGLLSGSVDLSTSPGDSRESTSHLEVSHKVDIGVKSGFSLVNGVVVTLEGLVHGGDSVEVHGASDNSISRGVDNKVSPVAPVLLLNLRSDTPGLSSSPSSNNAEGDDPSVNALVELFLQELKRDLSRPRRLLVGAFRRHEGQRAISIRSVVHGIVSTEEGVAHHEEVSSVLSEGYSAEASTDIPARKLDNVISGLHLKPDILLLIIEGSRH